MIIGWWYRFGGLAEDHEDDQDVAESASVVQTVPARALLVYSSTSGRWTIYQDNILSMLVEEDTDRLVAGHEDGFARELESDDPDTETFELEAITKDFVGGSPRTRKLFQWIRPDVDLRGTAETVTVWVYVDDELVHVTSITGQRRRPLLPLPAGAIGFRWRVRFRYIGQTRIRLYGCAMIGTMLRPA